MHKGTLKGVNDIGGLAHQAPLKAETKNDLVLAMFSAYRDWLVERTTSNKVLPVTNWFFELPNGETHAVTEPLLSTTMSGLNNAADALDSGYAE
jgi:hypothetical protein